MGVGTHPCCQFGRKVYPLHVNIQKNSTIKASVFSYYERPVSNVEQSLLVVSMTI